MSALEKIKKIACEVYRLETAYTLNKHIAKNILLKLDSKKSLSKNDMDFILNYQINFKKF